MIQFRIVGLAAIWPVDLLGVISRGITNPARLCCRLAEATKAMFNFMLQ